MTSAPVTPEQVRALRQSILIEAISPVGWRPAATTKARVLHYLVGAEARSMCGSDEVDESLPIEAKTPATMQCRQCRGNLLALGLTVSFFTQIE